MVKPPRTASRRGPLRGVRVVSLAQNLPGPLALARLVAAGVAAHKIEPPGGDPMRGFSPLWYRRLHRGIRVEAVDLKSPSGRAHLHERLSSADLVLTSQRPSALTRLGLTRTQLQRHWPQLRWLNIVGDTKAPEHAGHDLTYQATAGLLGTEMPASLWADILGAEHAYAAALLLLHRKAPCAEQVGLRDALGPAVLARSFGLTSSGGLLAGGLPTYRIYDTRSGRVAVAALEPHFRNRLYSELGLPDGAALETAMLARTAVQWERWAAARDIPVVKVAHQGRRD